MHKRLILLISCMFLVFSAQAKTTTGNAFKGITFMTRVNYSSSSISGHVRIKLYPIEDPRYPWIEIGTPSRASFG